MDGTDRGVIGDPTEGGDLGTLDFEGMGGSGVTP